MKTPILFLIYNRPETTLKVFEKIREVRPSRLYIAADGHKPGEEKKCIEAREIVENIDWNCNVKKFYRNKNLGCKIAVSSAIDWFFENEEMGIILEDDCLPDISFFGFCENLLEKYKDDKKIMMICGTSYLPDNLQYNFSYYFSHYYSVWGWATWGRAWKLYDPTMKDFYTLKENGFFKNVFPTKQMAQFFEKVFSDTKEGKINTWDYQWAYSCLISRSLVITPIKNLISNIGYGSSRENVVTKSKTCGKSTSSINTANIHHPPYVHWNYTLDKKLWENIEKTRTHRNIYKIREIRKFLKKLVPFINNEWQIQKVKFHRYVKKAQRKKIKTCHNSRKTLAIVVPCFKHASFLSTTFESMVHQTRKPDEIIFIDDASPDSTLKLLFNFKEAHPELNIILISNHKNMGQSHSLNKSIFISQSDLIMVLNDDDYLMHNAVELALDVMQTQREIHLCGFSCEVFTNDIDIKYYDKMAELVWQDFVIRTPKDVWKYKKCNDLNLTHSSSVFTKHAWQVVKGYFEQKKKRVVLFSDRDFQLRINCYFPVGIFPDIKMAFWRRGNSVDRGINS